MSDDTPRDDRAATPQPADPALTALLRGVYAPPADPAYWDALEARIVARVRPLAAPTEWWQELGGWTRAGAMAAGLAALLAGAALVESRSAAARAGDSQVAYEAVVDGAQSMAAVAVARSEHASRAAEREATLRYVITH